MPFERNKKTYSLYGDLIKFLYDVKQSLRTTQRIAKEWESRPKFREAQPRWTYDDEAAYRGEVLYWTHDYQAYLPGIQALLDGIENELDYIKQLRQWLLDDLGLKEARISNRSADDVRIFTYATVVFLPLSFVSSIFSMSEAPDRATVQPFIIAAIVALVATIVFLLNAGTPMRNITYYKNEFLKLPQDDSILEHADSQWKAVFKTFYFRLLISPARRVLTARDILAQQMKKHKQRKEIGTPENRSGSVRSIGKGKIIPRRQEKPIPDERNSKQQRKIKLMEKLRRRQETTQVVIGLLLLPLFLLSILLRFIGQNFFDLAEFLLITLPHYPGRRIKQEVSKIEDDTKSVESHSKPSANEMKGAKNSETMMKHQEKLKDQKKILKQFRDSNIKRFIQTPRFRDLGQYLQQGSTWDEAREELKQKKKEANDEFKETRASYKRARKIMKQAAKMDGKTVDIDLGMDVSSDDNSGSGKDPSTGRGAPRFRFSVPRLFRSRHGKTEQQERDAEKAGAKESDDDVERVRRSLNKTLSTGPEPS